MGAGDTGAQNQHIKMLLKSILIVDTGTDTGTQERPQPIPILIPILGPSVSAVSILILIPDVYIYTYIK